jgi:hypothetical protein
MPEGGTIENQQVKKSTLGVPITIGIGVKSLSGAGSNLLMNNLKVVIVIFISNHINGKHYQNNIILADS